MDDLMIMMIIEDTQYCSCLGPPYPQSRYPASDWKEGVGLHIIYDKIYNIIYQYSNSCLGPPYPQSRYPASDWKEGVGRRRNVTWPRFRTGTAYGTHSLGVRQHAYSQKIVGYQKKNCRKAAKHKKDLFSYWQSIQQLPAEKYGII